MTGWMTRDEALERLRLIHRSPQADQDLAALAETVRRDWPEDFSGVFPKKQDLAGRPSALNPRDFHLNELTLSLEAARRAGASPALDARIRYHARWLLFLGSPGPGTLPKVSLVIPTYNRAWAIGSLMANCFRQTYGNIEIVVVDDGSTDGSLDKLRAFGDRIKLVPQENKGVSGARNAGIAAASGELIHFLDSDNLLHPEHIAEKVQAFATIPDAEHCYCRAVEVAMFGTVSAVKLGITFLPDEGEFSPTDDFLTYSVIKGFPFLVTASTLPRHTLLSVAPAFDEDLRRAEDSRLWFRLAVGGIKTMRVGRRLFYRIRMTDGLNEARTVDKASSAVVAMRALLDLLGAPGHWPQVVQFLTARANARKFEESDGINSAVFDADFRRLLDVVAALPEIEDQSSISALPVLMVLDGFARHEAQRARSDVERWRVLSAAAGEAMARTRDWRSLNGRVWKEQPSELQFSKWFHRFLSARPSGPAKGKAAEVGLARAFLMRAAIPKPVRRFPGFVTFVVPVCDRPDAAAATIRSVLGQGFSGMARIIVVDSDRTRLSEWRQFPPAVSALYAETFAEAHAVALDARKTGLIRFLRPGDRLMPGVLRKHLLQTVFSPTRVLIETGAPFASGSFDRLPLEAPFVRLSRMWFPKWLIAKIGGFDTVLGNAFEKRYALRLRAGRVPFKAIPVRTEWSDIGLSPDARGAALGAVGSLPLALANPHLWKYLPNLFQDLAASGFAGSEPGTIVRRIFEILDLDLASLAEGKDRSSLLPALALCLAGIAQCGPDLPPELVALRRTIEDMAKDQGGEDRAQSFYAGLIEGSEARSLAAAIAAAIESTPSPPLRQELRRLQAAIAPA
jgi:hypothetical protein